MEVVCKPYVVVGLGGRCCYSQFEFGLGRSHLLNQFSRKPFRIFVPRHKFQDSAC